MNSCSCSLTLQLPQQADEGAVILLMQLAKVLGSNFRRQSSEKSSKKMAKPHVIFHSDMMASQCKDECTRMYRLHTSSHTVVSISLTANQTPLQTPASYLATLLHFHGDAIKSTNKEKEGGKKEENEVRERRRER